MDGRNVGCKRGGPGRKEDKKEDRKERTQSVVEPEITHTQFLSG